MDDNKALKVKFAPGVLEQLEQDMSPEDLQLFLNELQQMAESGAIIEQSEPIDMDQLRVEDPELYEILSKQLDGVFTEDEPPTLH